MKGANATLVEISVGASYEFRGVRNDDHDAFGLELCCYGRPAVYDGAIQPVVATTMAEKAALKEAAEEKARQEQRCTEMRHQALEQQTKLQREQAKVADMKVRFQAWRSLKAQEEQTQVRDLAILEEQTKRLSLQDHAQLEQECPTDELLNTPGRLIQTCLISNPELQLIKQMPKLPATKPPGVKHVVLKAKSTAVRTASSQPPYDRMRTALASYLDLTNAARLRMEPEIGPHMRPVGFKEGLIAPPAKRRSVSLTPPPAKRPCSLQPSACSKPLAAPPALPKAHLWPAASSWLWPAASGTLPPAAVSQPAVPWPPESNQSPTGSGETVAKGCWKNMFDFFADRMQTAHNEDELFNEAKQLRSLLFQHTKKPVPEDLWIPCKGPAGEQQFVDAVVSEGYVLEKLMLCIQTREDWLTSQNFPTDMKMRHGPAYERAAFVKHCKDKFHAEPHQLRQQQRDYAEGGANLRKNKKKSRWARHMQIEMGSKQLWEVVSFTGKFDSTFLNDLLVMKRDAAVAPQHSDQHDDQHDDQPDTKRRTAKEDELKANAFKCKGDLRWARSLKRKQDTGCSDFSPRELAFLTDLDSGKLIRLSNEAVRAHGHGRLYYEDGSFKDIGPATGGLTRSFLDNWTLPDDSLDFTTWTPPDDDDRNAESYNTEEGDWSFA